ncbi:MAG TPA: hypothetical protein VNM37_02100 [Candidatus Dormibacteraeota bacterium]|nr:hypothetical protein [Candidatus Dormibacteraeota bacterium]
MAKVEAQVRSKQGLVNEWRVKLGITADGEDRSGGAPTAKADVLQRLQAESVTARSDYARTSSLYRNLTNMNRVELRRALPNIITDPLLARLFEEQALNEQKQAGTQTANSPELEGLRRVQATIDRQIEERMEGILRGMEVRLQSDRERMESLERAVEDTRRADIKTSIERTPYYDAKRDLETFRFLWERLQARLLQEKIDARLQEP